jgi:hypothetical protein
MEVIWTKENKEKIIEMLGGTTIPIQYWKAWIYEPGHQGPT